MDLQELIMRYGIVTRRRFYEKEKIRFLCAFKQEVEKLGYSADVKVAEKAKTKAYNMYIGDVKKAKLIVMTNYDTPAKSFGLYKHKPFLKKDSKLCYVSQLLPVLVLMLLTSLLIGYVLAPVWQRNVFSLSGLAGIAICLGMVALVKRFRRGMGNRNNLVGNTSSLLAILLMMNELPVHQRKKIAFCLTDFGYVNGFGEYLLEQEAGSEFNKKQIISLDSIGSFDELFVLADKDSDSLINALPQEIRVIVSEQKTNSEAANHRRITITSGKKVNNQIVVEKIGSLRDSDLDQEKVAAVSSIKLNLASAVI